MLKYVIEREILGAGNLSDAELKEISQKSLTVLKGMGPEIQWLQSYVRATGSTACISHPMKR